MGHKVLRAGTATKCTGGSAQPYSSFRLKTLNANSLLGRTECDRMTHGKSLKRMAEGTGLEPAGPCGRRFSRPLHYQLCYPSAMWSLVTIPHQFQSTQLIGRGKMKL